MTKEIEEQLIKLVFTSGSQEKFSKIGLPPTMPGRPFHPTAVQVAIVMPNGELKEMHAGKVDWKEGKKSKDIDGKTTFRIGSATKAVTAGTFLSLIDNERYNSWFPDGVSTKLKDVLPKLHEAYPENKFLASLSSETVGHFADITMQDFANHTHGMGTRHQQKTWDMAISGARTGKLVHPEDALETTVPQTEEGAQYEKVTYGSLGPNMLAVIATAAFRDVEEKSDATFSDVKRAMLVDKVSGVTRFDMPMHDETFEIYKYGSNAARGYKEQQFTPDGKHKQLIDSHLSPHSPGAAGGQMANALGLAKVLFSIWTANPDKSLYENKGTRDAMYSDLRKNTTPGYPYRDYGTARYSMDFGGGIRGKGHGGDDGGFLSNAIHIEEGELAGCTAVVIWSGETLTPRMATDIMKQSKDPDFISFAKMGEGIEKILETESGSSFTQMEDRVLKTMQPDEQTSYKRAKQKHAELIEHLNERFTPQQLVEHINDIISDVATERINERSHQNLDALDLASLSEEAKTLSVQISTKPSVEPDSKNEEKNSWVDRSARTNPRLGFNKRPGGSREI